MIDQHKQPLLVLATEFWCHSTITDAEIYLNGCSLYRKDRSVGMDGGVLLYVHESLSIALIHRLNIYHVEDSVWCSITLSGSDSMLIGSVYGSPNSSAINNDKLLHLLQNLLTYHTFILIATCF